MARLFGKREGTWVDIPEEQVQAAYQSGQYAFAKGARVNVQMPDGRYGTLGEEELGGAIQAGATYEALGDKTERVERESYDARNLEAASLGLARGLSFGISDVALEKLGAYSEEELAKIEEHNSVLSGVGEIAGLVAPALLSGGSSLLAKGAQSLTASGLATRAGIAAEKTVAGALGLKQAASTAEKMVKGGASLSAAAGVEGVLFGAVDGWSEDQLGRVDKTAEQIMLDAGGFGVLSGGIGALIGMGIPVVGKGLSLAWGNKLSKGVRDKAAMWEAEIATAMHGGDMELARKLLDPEYAHKVVFGTKEVTKKTGRHLKNFIDDALDGVEIATLGVVGPEKARLMGELVESGNSFHSIDTAVAVLADMRRSIRGAHNAEKVRLHSGEFKAIDAAIDAEIDLIAKRIGKAAGKDSGVVLLRYGDDLRASFADDAVGNLPRLSDIYKPGDLIGDSIIEGLLPQVYMSLDSLKRSIGGKIYKGRVREASPAGESLADILDSTYMQLKNTLESESLFGARAATAQKDINAAFHELIPVLQRFKKSFTKFETGAPVAEATRTATETAEQATIRHAKEGRKLDEVVSDLSKKRKKLTEDRTYDPFEIEDLYQDLEMTVDRSRLNFREGLKEDKVASAYVKKQKELDIKIGSLQGTLTRIKQAKTPSPEKLTAFRKELNETVDEAVAHANNAPKMVGESDEFLEAVAEHAGKQKDLTRDIDSIKKQIEKAKKAKVKDPDALAALDKKLDDAVGVSVKHENAKPVAKDFIVTRTFGEAKRQKRVAKWGAVDNLVKKAHRLEGAAQDQFDRLQDFIGSYGNFLRAVERNHDSAGLIQISKSQKFSELTGRHYSLMKDCNELADILAAHREIKSSYSPIGTLLSMAPVGGLAAGGPLGYLGARVAGSLVTPGAAVRRRAVVHEMKSRASAALDKGVSRATKRILDNIKTPTKQRASLMPTLLAVIGVKSSKDPKENTRLAMENIGQLTSPELLVSKIEKATEQLEGAPKLKDELTANIVKQVQFLASEASTHTSAEHDAFTGEAVFAVSDAALAEFSSVVNIAGHGAAAVADRGHDGTLTKKEAQTFMTLYPVQHAEMVEKCMEKLSGKSVAYADKLCLSTLAGAPLTSTLNPEFMMAMRNVHKISEQSVGGRKNENALKNSVGRGRLPVEGAMMRRSSYS